MKLFFPIKFSGHALVIAMVLLFVSPIVNAQKSGDKGYTVGPGDVLQIQVWDNDDLNRNIEISQDGTFSFPLIGKIDATDLSVNDVKHILTERLGNGYLVAPQIEVTVSEYNNKRVFLFGEVVQPGSYSLRHDIRLLELISEAGGFTNERGEICQIVRTKKDVKNVTPVSIEDADANEIIMVDLNRLISGQPKENIGLLPGDSIYINPVNHVFVTGEVRNPGKVKWLTGMTVRQSISMAGGGTQSAAVDRTTIIRLEKGHEVEVKPGLSDPVYPNDIIRVPESYF
jgi:polysaccharide export outer membrane protein